jgi:protein-disulfide isomerase
MTAFNKCLQSNDSKIKVQQATNQAYADGVNSTPTFSINGEIVIGALPFEDFRAKIEQALAGANP